MKSVSFILLSLTTFACDTSSAKPPSGPASTCAADAAQNLLGQPAIHAETIDGHKRIIPPGSAITMDYNPLRTNFDLDNSGNITRIWCG